jgi:sulfur carrier protein
MKVTVNDTVHQAADATTLATLLDSLGIAASSGVAIAVNQAVVPRSQWTQRRLSENDHLLIIQATQGG